MENRLYEYNFFKTNKVLKEEAKEGIKGNKGSSLAINFIYFLVKLCFLAGITLLIVSLVNIRNDNFNFITGLIVAGSLLLVAFFFFGPLRLSVCKNAINMVENTKPSFKDIGYGFKNYGRSLNFSLSLFFSYLLNLILLVVPFVFRYIDLQFAGFILAENDEIKVGDAFRLSKDYLKGYRKHYISLVWAYIVDFILSIISCYVYSLWVRPKFNCAVYCLYRDLKS